jgi:magnesium transporter
MHNHPEENKDKIIFADDDTESVGLLLRLRLLVGLLGGVAVSVIVSRFEAILNANVALAFFIPFIVYISGAVGTQTETIYVRNAADGKINAKKYLIKEFFLGIFIGLILGAITGIFCYIWIGDAHLAQTVGLAMLINIALAPLIALGISYKLNRLHSDPALGAGPFTTIIQDLISVFIYLIIASIILL